jgi:hypothetical protein
MIGKADGVLKEDGMFRVREIFWKRSTGGGAMCEEGRYLGK